jgi:hypothetical protein
MDPVKFADYHLWANDRVRVKLMELIEDEYSRDSRAHIPQEPDNELPEDDGQRGS